MYYLWKKIPAIKVSFAPIISLGISNLSLDDDNKYYSHTKFSSNFYPSIGILLNTSLPRLSEKLSLQLETQLNQNHYFSNTSNNITTNIELDSEIHVNVTLLQSSMAFKFTNTNKKVRPTMALGTIVNYFIKNESIVSKETKLNGSIISSYEFDGKPFPSFLWGGFIQLGCDFHLSKKHVMLGNLKYGYCFGDNQETKVKIQSLDFSIGLYL